MRTGHGCRGESGRRGSRDTRTRLKKVDQSACRRAYPRVVGGETETETAFLHEPRLCRYFTRLSLDLLTPTIPATTADTGSSHSSSRWCHTNDDSEKRINGKTARIGGCPERFHIQVSGPFATEPRTANILLSKVDRTSACECVDSSWV